MTDETTKLENIQKLYKQVYKKTEFIIMLAGDLGKSPLTIRNYWFSKFWRIPEEHEDRIIELLQNTIYNQ